MRAGRRKLYLRPSTAAGAGSFGCTAHTFGTAGAARFEIELSINEKMFEEVADAIQMQFSEWAENGAEDGELNFPEKIKSAFVDFDDEEEKDVFYLAC